MKSISIFVSNDLVTDQRIQRFADTLYNSGWQVHVIGRIKKKSKPIGTCKYQYERVNTYFEKGIGFYLLLNFIFFIRALFSNSKVLYSVDLDTLPSIRLASFFRKKILIWDCHEIFPFMPELYTSPFKQKIWIALEKIFVPGIKRTLTVNTGVANYLKQNHNIQPTIIHNYPYHLSTFGSISDRLQSKIILFQGALNEGRLLDTMILAMKKVNPELNLILAGDGPLKIKMEQLCRNENLQSRISFTGELRPDDLKVWTDRARIGISLLNKEHRNSWFSLANKNLDYIMAALPAVSVNFPEYQWINQRWPVAILLDEIQVESVAQAINNLYEDQEEYLKLYNNCIEARKELCWEQEVNRFNTFFEELKV